MRVLIINLDKNIFEPGSKSLERLKIYARFCEKLSVIVLTKKVFQPIIIHNLSVFATGSCCRAFYFKNALKLAQKIILSEQIDLVVSQDPFDTGHIGWLIKKKFRLPWQCQVHTDFLSPYFTRQSILNKIRVLLAKFLIRRADGFRVVSERIKRSLIKLGISESKIFVLPIFVDTEKFRSVGIGTDLKQKYPQFNFIILMASRLSPEKNIGLAIDAMVEVIKKYPKTGLIIIGEGKEKSKLEALVRSHNLQSNIIFELWSDDLASCYKTADLFLLTSNYEGWGMATVEALAAGCPVAMTDVGCAGELIKDNENGLVIPVGDKKALIWAIKKVLEDAGFRERLVKAGSETIEHLPNQEQYLAVYKNSWGKLL